MTCKCGNEHQEICVSIREGSPTHYGGPNKFFENFF